MNKKCELWFSEENGYSFFPEENESARRLLTPSCKLIWDCEAKSWGDASTKKIST